MAATGSAMRQQEMGRRLAGRPRKDEVAARRSHLLAVATALFLERGYHRVSLALIAREARVAVRTIYMGFGGKAGLFGAVLRAGRQRLMDSGQELDPAAPMAEALGGFALRYLRLLADPPAQQLRRIVLVEAGGSPELAQAYQDAGPGLTRALLARYFADPRVRAQLRADVSPDLLPAHFIACIAGEHLWLGSAIGDASCDGTMQRVLEARLPLFLRSVLLAPP